MQKDYWERKELNTRRSPEHPVVAEYVVSKINELRRYIRLTKRTRLLDVGCGNGFFTYYFDKICDTYGVDFSKKMLQMNPIKKTYLMQAENLQFEDGSFDVVFCHALLHHVENIDRVIQEMRRSSKQYVVIIEPNRNNPLIFLFSLLVKEERKALKFSLNFLKNKMIKNDLQIIAFFSHGILVPNKTPVFILYLMKLLEFKQLFGMTNIVIAKKHK
ncbi:MAG: class I SAM-dependent methyltransferase [Candidatus Aminicenantes bacterium]|nr:class I SAM-dependent methyltransferase [Candidatus Aminicenantes bacterium]